MSLRRLEISLAVPEDKNGKLPIALESQWNSLLSEIRAFKQASVKINAGLANEEDTIKASWHVCHHDTGEACEPKIDI